MLILDVIIKFKFFVSFLKYFLLDFRSRISPLLVHENHEPIEFSNSFPIWKEPDRKILFEEKVRPNYCDGGSVSRLFPKDVGAEKLHGRQII